MRGSSFAVLWPVAPSEARAVEGGWGGGQQSARPRQWHYGSQSALRSRSRVAGRGSNVPRGGARCAIFASILSLLGRAVQEGAAQGARGRGGGRARPQAVPAGGAAGAAAARAGHARAGGAAARAGPQRVAGLAHAGAVRAREPAVRRRVRVLQRARARLRRHGGPGRPQLRVVRRARQEVARRGAAVRRLRHDLHAEDRPRRDRVPDQVRERVPGALRHGGAARGAAAVPRGGASVRRALPRAGAAAPARAPAPHLRAPHRARPPLRAARPQGDRGAARPGGGAAAVGAGGGRGARGGSGGGARRDAAAAVGVTRGARKRQLRC